MTFQIYGKDNCVFCEKTKILLTQKNLPFQYFTLNKEFTRDELFEIFPSAKTFPQIKLDTGEIIGGFTDLERYLAD